jgi:hypothetical protein
MAQNADVRCDYCGKVDNHPKSHWQSGESYHHDCLPYDKRALVIETSEHGQAIIEAAENGVHGAELLAHIRELHGKDDD